MATIKTLGDTIQEVAENLGILDVNGNAAFDATTSPTLARVKQYVNDSLKEIVDDFPYDNLQKNVWVPWYHTINDVPAATLSGFGTGTLASFECIGTVVPFPSINALKASDYILPPNFNWAGISFLGRNPLIVQSGFIGVSTTGVQTTATWSGVGYFYELPEYVDSILQISMPDKGVVMQYVPNYDMNLYNPQGVWSSTGPTPAWYTEIPGLSQDNKKVIEFFPMPDTSLTSGHFLLTYKNKQIDLTSNNDQQTILPSQFQNIPIHATLEKCYMLINDLQKSAYHGAQKTKLIMELRKWSENNPNYVNRFRDGHYISNVGTGPVGTDLAVGYMVNGFGH